jgi:hypothetical protein
MAKIEIHLEDMNKFENSSNLRKVNSIKFIRNLTGKSLQTAKGDVDEMVDKLQCFEMEIGDTINLTTDSNIQNLRGMGYFIKGMSDFHAYKELLQPIIDKAMNEDRMSAVTHMVEALKDIKANKI